MRKKVDKIQDIQVAKIMRDVTVTTTLLIPLKNHTVVWWPLNKQRGVNRDVLRSFPNLLSFA